LQFSRFHKYFYNLQCNNDKSQNPGYVILTFPNTLQISQLQFPIYNIANGNKTFLHDQWFDKKPNRNTSHKNTSHNVMGKT
jgi:hypothetical protein